MTAENCNQPTRRALLQAASAVTLGSLLPLTAEAAWPLPEKRPVEMTENIWVTVRDGTRLACRLWVPKGADKAPVGVVLEALPYSKRDGTRGRDNAWADQFCPYGFAYARLDLRGSGESDGLLHDEYLAQEQQDIVDAIAFLARQPWCNGSVGMRGISWGGFNSLQVAALAPPALKAIVTACSTDNRYMDDAHYIGGVLGLTCLHWGTMFRNVLVDAPDPQIVGDRWRDMWMERLRNAPAIHARWLSHPTYDAYWKHGSVEQDYGAIKCAVYAVGGQVDSYSAAIPRLLEGLSAPRKGLIGSWGHQFPDGGNPGPGLDWVVEEVRWWAHWLHGVDTGIMREPMLRAYINERTPSEVWPADTPGHWVAEAQWPSPAIRNRVWHLNEAGLAAQPGAEAQRTIAPHQTLGTAKREWLPFNMALDLPGEQSHDDGLALVFDSAPLAEDVEMLGIAKARLRIAADRPVAKVVVRVNELLPDGKSWSVTYGVLNLTHRESHSDPSLLEPGKAYDVTVPFAYGAHRFKKGSRIRVAISEALWPMLAPSPEPVTLAVTTGASRLELPVRPYRAGESVGDLPALLRDRQQSAKIGFMSVEGETIRQTGPDADGKVTVIRNDPASRFTIDDIATDRTGQTRMELSIVDGDPTSSVWRVTAGWGSTRADWDFRTLATTELRMTSREFIVTETMQAFERDKVVFEKTEENRIERRFS
ncbi:CocE/NonD family hydrolase [Rhizorhabdus histidinilytica]|uniref:CocE/NonD family hydrolase n=1 Tax=Rhizorhabdus histidinilytica TaxID=439228 RepID=UPI00321F8EB6